MFFSRKSYLNQLISHKNNGMIKIISGVRRCGKSYLLNTIFKSHLLSEGVEYYELLEHCLGSLEQVKSKGWSRTEPAPIF